jgi:RES domain-containing protein
MILTNLGPDAPFYRAFTPHWAHAPESGAGAAVRGGRFNRPGIEARYLAATTEAALIEYRAESALLPPATIASFLVTANNVVDFTEGFHADTWREIWAEAYCNWKMLAFVDDIEPPSWVIGDLVREAGHPGILYRSARDPSMTCLVLFPDLAAKTQFRAPVHDPDNRLPRDSSSWRKG